MSWLAAALLALAPQDPAPAAEAAASPRLCVVLLVDQMIPDQFERLEPWLTGGLGRLWREGRVYRRASVEHSLSFTAPGHVSAATGTYPSRHGVVANAWYNRETRSTVYCCEDEDARMVSSDGVQSEQKSYRRSPVLAQVPGIAHHIEQNVEGARSLAICGKDRAAIALAGRSGELGLWWDWRTGAGFVTSTCYGDALPEWTREWNSTWRGRASGFDWSRSFEGDLRGSGTAEDEREGEYSAHGWTRSMPHKLPVIESDAPEKEASRLARVVYESALCDEFVAEMALQALATGEYGTDDELDVLSLAFSSTDTVGHLFGPMSVEVTDTVLRLDRLLAKIFDDLDERVGKGNWVCGMTSDHGVLELPEALNERGIGAVRVPRKELDGDRRALAAHLEERFVKGLVMTLRPEGIYLDRKRIAESGLDGAEVRAAVRDFLVANTTWLGQAYTQEEILLAQAEGTEDAWLKLASHSYSLERSPDVFTQQKPWHLLGEAAGTTHGSPYVYDRRVPLIFLGPGFESEARFEEARTIDLVPTLLGACGIESDFEFDGRDLSRD